MRTFLGLPLFPQFQDPLESFLGNSARELPDVKWIRPSNAHITLHFFGNTTDEEIHRICEIMPPVFKSLSAPSISLSEIGFFPGPQKPDVIWLGISQGEEAVAEIQKAAVKSLQNAGFTSDSRPYRAHATVGRGRGLSKKDREKAAALQFAETGAVSINHAVLYESVSSPEGVRYETLTEFPFS